jgi:hypothetical protein
MSKYRSSWLLAWSTTSLLGVCLALLLWPVGAVVLLFAVAATTAALIHLCTHGPVDVPEPDVPQPDVPEPEALRSRLRRVAVRAGAIGVGAVAVVALAAVAPHLMLVLLLLVGATSPHCVELVRGHLDDRKHRLSGLRPGQARAWSATAASTAQGLTDHDLCHAWCTSFDVLQSTSDVEARARIVCLRQAYLDELERRDPHGLHAWLTSGARATGNPDRYLSDSRADRRRDQ